LINNNIQYNTPSLDLVYFESLSPIFENKEIFLVVFKNNIMMGIGL